MLARLRPLGHISGILGAWHLETSDHLPLHVGRPLVCKGTLCSQALVHCSPVVVALPVVGAPRDALDFAGLPTPCRSTSSNLGCDASSSDGLRVKRNSTALSGCCTSLAPLPDAKKRWLRGKQSILDNESTTMQDLVGEEQLPCDLSASQSDQQLKD